VYKSSTFVDIVKQKCKKMSKTVKDYEVRTRIDRELYKHISKQAESMGLSIVAYLRMKLIELRKKDLV
jgi:vacuolar-type H+-ATPase subunit C/Vma6